MIKESSPETPGTTSNSSGDRTGFPYLWVSDIVAGQPLAHLFSGIFSIDTAPGRIPQGQHIICLDPSTNSEAEVQTKAIAYRLMAVGCQVGVHELHVHPLAWLCQSGDWRAADELVMTINEFHRPYKEWAASIEYGLKIDEALALAKLAIQGIPKKTQLNIELRSLMVRAKVNELNWGKYIRDLEADLHAAVDSSSSDDSDERLKLEVAAYQKETNIFRKKQLRGKICSHYRLSREDLKELEQELEKQHTKPKQRSYSFNEFFNQNTQAIQWVIPGLLPAAETVLFAAQAKCGKTAFITDVIYAVLAGDTVAGEQAMRGKVLIHTSDESANTTRRRMRDRGIDLLTECHNLRVLPYLDITDLNELEAELEDFRPQLMAIDSLTTITDRLGVSEKDPEFARYLYRLASLLNKYNVAGIITHHENKDPLAKGINKISGSARIAAAVWGIWQIDRVNPDDKQDARRKLLFQPREGAAAEYRFEMNPKDLWAAKGIFEFQGEAGDEQGEKRTHGEKVLALLAKYSPRGLTYAEIDERLKVGRTLYSVLDRLEDRQQIERRRSETNSKQWVYAIPDLSNWHKGDSLSRSDDQLSPTKETEILSTQELEVIQQTFSSHSANIQQPILTDELLNPCNAELEHDSLDIQQVQPKRQESVPPAIESVTVAPCSTDRDEAENTNPQSVGTLPPIGWWVRVGHEGRILAQVTAHCPTGAVLEAENFYGVCSEMTPLTQEEMLKKGLHWRG